MYKKCTNTIYILNFQRCKKENKGILVIPTLASLAIFSVSNFPSSQTHNLQFNKPLIPYVTSPHSYSTPTPSPSVAYQSDG